MLGITDAERHPIENDDCVSNWSTEALAFGSEFGPAPERHYADESCMASIVEHQLESLDSEVFRPKKT